MCINEVAWAVGVLGLPAVKLLGTAKNSRPVLRTAMTLLNNVGGARVSRIAEHMNKVGAPVSGVPEAAD